MTDLRQGGIKKFFYIFLFCVSFVFVLSALVGLWSNRIIISMREYMLMNHYLSASIASYKTFGKKGTKRWLCEIAKSDGLNLMLVKESGEAISCIKPNKKLLAIKDETVKNKVKFTFFKSEGYIIVNNDTSINNKNYWIISSSRKISWAPDFQYPILTRLVVGLFLSVIIYIVIIWFISVPLLNIRRAFKKLSSGKLNERINENTMASLQDVRQLNKDFNVMGGAIEKVINLKENIIEIISHELKSPLARQRAALNILQHQKVYSDSKYINRINLENKKINKIIYETLDYIKLHREKQVLQNNSFDLIQMLNKIIEDVSFEFGDIDYKLNIPEKYIFNGDKSLMAMAFENIIINATKHSPKKTIITINLIENNNQLEFSVSDRGPGIKHQNLDNVFEPYFKEKSTTSSSISHGLGLSITKKIILLHNGTIKAKNRKNGGLTIYMVIPFSDYF